MTIIYILAGMLLTFLLVVSVHELGHYAAARLVGVRSTVFSIGFGKVLWSHADRRGTLWQICAIPLGGYCRFIGDENAASLKSSGTSHVIEGSLDAASISDRTFVVLAGPVANLVLSFLLFWFATAFAPEPLSLFEGFGRAVTQMVGFVTMSATGLAATVAGLGDFCKLSGPLGIADLSGRALQLGPHVFFQFMAVISAGLAITNLLPIPGLDGGHLVSYATEALTGQPTSERIKKVLFIVGITLICYLMIMATLADVLC